MVVGAAGGKACGTRRQRLAQELLHTGTVVSCGRLLPCSALAHDEKAQAVVRHQRHKIEAVAHRAERIGVVGKARPAPLHAFGQHGAGNLLDALHELYQSLFLAFFHRGEADTAVAHHHRGDAVIDARTESLVPGRLTVVMGVDVDEPGHDERARGVDRVP